MNHLCCYFLVICLLFTSILADEVVQLRTRPRSASILNKVLAIEASVPYKQGRCMDVNNVRLETAAGGVSVPRVARALARWPTDSSLRFVLLTFNYNFSLFEYDYFNATCQDQAVGAEQELVFESVATLPPTLNVSLQRTWPVSLDSGLEFTIPIDKEGQQVDYILDHSHSYSVDVEPLTPSMTRIRCMLLLRYGNESYSKYSLRLPMITSGVAIAAASQTGACLGTGGGGGLCLSVKHAGDSRRGLIDVSLEPNTLVVMLYQSYSSDGTSALVANFGAHFTHELHIVEYSDNQWTLSSFERMVAEPPRAFVDPTYLHESGAFFGRTGVDLDDVAGTSFASVTRYLLDRAFANYSLLCSAPHNANLHSYGDQRMFGNTAYWGWANQEYDIGASLAHLALVSRDETWADAAELRAQQYADNSVTLEGEVMQHRTSLYGVYAHVAIHLAIKVREFWRQGGDTPLTPLQIASFMTSAGVANANDLVTSWIQMKSPWYNDYTPFELEWELAAAWGYDLSKQAFGNVKASANSTLFTGYVTYKTLINVTISQSAGLQLILGNNTTIDDLFDDFFQRYGGSFDQFNQLGCVADGCGAYVHLHPLANLSAAFPGTIFRAPQLPGFTEGGHVLLEQMAGGYLLSGNRFLRERALAVARHMINPVYHFMDDNKAMLLKEVQLDELTHARRVGWPLMLMMAAATLVAASENGDELDLFNALESNMSDYVQWTLENIPNDANRGYLGQGIMLEGLARYVEYRELVHATTEHEVVQYVVEAVKKFVKPVAEGGCFAVDIATFRYRCDEPVETKFVTGANGLVLSALAFALSRDKNDCNLRQRYAQVMCGMKKCAYSQTQSSMSSLFEAKPLAMTLRQVRGTLSYWYDDLEHLFVDTNYTCPSIGCPETGVDESFDVQFNCYNQSMPTTAPTVSTPTTLPTMSPSASTTTAETTATSSSSSSSSSTTMTTTTTTSEPLEAQPSLLQSLTNKPMYMIGLILALSLVVLLIISCVCFSRRRRRSSANGPRGSTNRQPSSPSSRRTSRRRASSAIHRSSRASSKVHTNNGTMDSNGANGSSKRSSSATLNTIVLSSSPSPSPSIVGGHYASTTQLQKIPPVYDSVLPTSPLNPTYDTVSDIQSPLPVASSSAPIYDTVH